jgi:lysozyme family protein
MSRVNTLIDEVILREGGYVDHPDDTGGPTNHGITHATLSKWRKRPVTADEVKSLTKDEARQIYLARYWYEPGFHQIAPISLPVAEEMTDTGVNMGPATAVKFLQRILTAFNNHGQLYPDLKVDGQLGPSTMGALRSYLAKRGTEGEKVLLFALDAMQTEGYVAIAERREKDESFVYGQILHRAAGAWI